MSKIQPTALQECNAKLSVTYAPAAILGGVFGRNPAPGTAQGALKKKLPTLLRYTRSTRKFTDY
jgi:hypothetical protein